MRIKRYLVRDMQEAYLAIRRELGPDAVIVSTRRVRRPGLKGFFQPPHLEVTAAAEAGSGSKATPREKALERELAEIRKTLEKLASPPAGEDGSLAAYRRLLLEQDMGEELTEALLAGLDGQIDEEVLGQAILARLAQYMDPPAGDKGRQERIRALVGPTGVGKTTTLAKLAARYSLYHRQRVGLITLDTYRIGAVEQLKTYAEIMRLPLEVAMTPKELKEAVARLEQCDVILVDTAGRPPENQAQLAETQGFLSSLEPLDVYLVLSGTTRSSDLLRAVEKYRVLQFNRLIFTKLDETSCPGVIARVVRAAGVPVAYVTAGQNVPDDLEEADPYSLAQLIWKAVTRNGSSSPSA
ncbi:flagellar biosynthesis protein FlhF [Thermanaeromonas sp. C210]|uniref:flagellar biosynthesis protein FlhF n=1 Tax=Thermanaeromonas sp. C210 TaxID=2731925 RepID=UPI00155D5173|nr:flagellar biosynthesis protein FlhF [Thermanaeromonas sp. C210]GFN24132.1 flagellar biosynthesis protein FlhF [Thermanaeromonas sp. C210]